MTSGPAAGATSGSTAGVTPGRGGEAGAALLLSALVLVFAPLSFAYNGVLSHARPPEKNDFTSYYVAGLAVREGMPEALYYPRPVGSLLAQASQQHPWIDLARPAGIEHPNYYLYPPFFAVLFAPLTSLPYKIAFAVWLGLGAIFLSASAALILTIFEAPRGSLRWTMAAAAIALTACLSYPVTRTLAVGQSSLLLLLLMTVVMVALRRRSRAGDAWAGMCLALGIMLKLTPAILLPWLVLRRRWRALGFCAAGFLALAAVSVAAVGIEPHRIYLSEMLGLLSGGTAFYPNQSLAGVLARCVSGNFRLADLVPASAASALLARWLGAVFVLVTLLLVARMRPGGAPDPETDDRAFGLLLLASLAASPISWEHHYVLALIPAWVLLRDAAEGRAVSMRRAALAGLALALVGSYIGLRIISMFEAAFLAQAAASSGFLGGLLLWWALASSPVNPPKRCDGRDWVAPAALLILLAVFATGTFLAKVMEYNRAYRYGDFTSYYIAAATLLEGEEDPLYYPDTPDLILARAETPSPWTETARRWGVRDANYYLYPPFFAMVLSPLVLLSYGAAHDVWYIVNLAALGGCVWLYIVTRRQAGQELTPPELALIVIAIALSWPSLFTFGAGQANFVVLLLLLGALAAMRSRREISAGLMTAGAAAIKMTPALLLAYLAWKRRWAALGAALTGIAVLVVLGGAVAGWDSYGVYAMEMVPLLSRGSAHWVNESLAGFFTRLLDGGDIFSWSLASPSTASRLLTHAASILLVAGAFWAIGSGGGTDSVIHRDASLGAGSTQAEPAGLLDLEFSLMVVTTLFVSPLSWTHHSVLSLLGFLLAVRWLVKRALVTWRMAFALGLCFTLTHIYVEPPGLFEHGPLRILASYNLAGNLMLWGILMMLIRRARSRPAGEAAPS